MALDPQSKKFLKSLGLKLREIRNEKGWTLEDVEEHGWSSWRHLQKIESRQKNINIVTLWKLAKVYKVSMNEILEEV